MPWRRDHLQRRKFLGRFCAVGRRFVLALTVALLFCPAHAVYGQCALARIGSNPKVCGGIDLEKLLPEDGLLASDSYTNRFFGFSIDLPITSEGHRITIPVMLEKQHALLAIGFQQERHFGTFVITAEESPKELPWYDDLQQECDDATPSGPQLRPSIPSGMLRYGSFYARQAHRGSYHIHHYWTRIKEYIIRVAVDSNDKEFLLKSKTALVKARFYCRQKGGVLITNKGKVFVPAGEPYEGPTVPTWLAEAAIKDQPGLGIPAGIVSQGVYRNPDLGLQYEFPKGWELLPAETTADPPEDARTRREYELLHACSRTLLRVAQPRSDSAAGQAPRPSIILRALDPGCLAMSTPASVEDKTIADQITADLELFSEFGEIKSDELVSLGDKLFVVFHGIIGWRAPGDVLSHRMSEALFATQHHELLLMWYLMAPTSAELAVMPPSNITFGGSQPIRLPPAEALH